ncbi:hypothetical protein ACLOJK_000220 [Asimina triloba]
MEGGDLENMLYMWKVATSRIRYYIICMYTWICCHDGEPSPDPGSSETCQAGYVAICEVGVHREPASPEAFAPVPCPTESLAASFFWLTDLLHLVVSRCLRGVPRQMCQKL